MTKHPAQPSPAFGDHATIPLGPDLTAEVTITRDHQVQVELPAGATLTPYATSLLCLALQEATRVAGERRAASRRRAEPEVPRMTIEAVVEAIYQPGSERRR